jgi:hypothetical protein
MKLTANYKCPYCGKENEYTALNIDDAVLREPVVTSCRTVDGGCGVYFVVRLVVNATAVVWAMIRKEATA